MNSHSVMKHWKSFRIGRTRFCRFAKVFLLQCNPKDFLLTDSLRPEALPRYRKTPYKCSWCLLHDNVLANCYLSWLLFLTSQILNIPSNLSITSSCWRVLFNQSSQFSRLSWVLTLSFLWWSGRTAAEKTSIPHSSSSRKLLTKTQITKRHL